MFQDNGTDPNEKYSTYLHKGSKSTNDCYNQGVYEEDEI